MTTDRTSIRRRLTVGRITHRPPRRVWKAGHRSIVAPLTATIAAAMAVGVGVVLASAERQRRSKRERVRQRRLGLSAEESLSEALPRIARGQLDLAIELLSASSGVADAKTVHETRKALKRLRALLRL